MVFRRTRDELFSSSRGDQYRKNPLGYPEDGGRRRAAVPSVLQPSMLAEVMNIRKEEKKYFLSEHQGALLKDILLFYSQEDEAKISSSVIILVGPEGGWTQKEEKIMLSHGYEAVSLGKSVLRAETAAISAVALVSHFWLEGGMKGSSSKED